MAGFAAGTLARGLRRGDELADARRRKAWEDMAAVAAELRLQQDRADAVEAAFLRPLKRTQAQEELSQLQAQPGIQRQQREAEQRQRDLEQSAIRGRATREQQDQEAQSRAEADRVDEATRRDLATRPYDADAILAAAATRFAAAGHPPPAGWDQPYRALAQSAGAAHMEKEYNDALAAAADKPWMAADLVSALRMRVKQFGTDRELPPQWVQAINATAEQHSRRGQAVAAVEQWQENQAAIEDAAKSAGERIQEKLNTTTDKAERARLLRLLGNYGLTAEATGDPARSLAPVMTARPAYTPPGVSSALHFQEPSPQLPPPVRVMPAPAAAGLGTAERLFGGVVSAEAAMPAAAMPVVTMPGTTRTTARTAAGRGGLTTSQHIEAMAQEMLTAVQDKTMTEGAAIKALNDAVAAGTISREEASLVRGKYNQFSVAARREAARGRRGTTKPAEITQAQQRSARDERASIMAEARRMKAEADRFNADPRFAGKSWREMAEMVNDEGKPVAPAIGTLVSKIRDLETRRQALNAWAGDLGIGEGEFLFHGPIVQEMR